MSSRILVVEDDIEIADLLEVYLTGEGYDVLKANTGKQAAEFIETEKIDLALLDVMLPDEDGFSLCQKIRQKENYPVIMLTAKDAEFDKVTGLTLGADDYMTKPFRPMELLARVKAQLRRYTRYNTPAAEAVPEKEAYWYTYKGVTLDKLAHECMLDGEKLPLTPTEFSILSYLLENQGRVISSEELFQKVWDEKYYSGNNTVMVHIRRLREKMKDSAERPKYIKTVWGVGYTIEQNNKIE